MADSSVQITPGVGAAIDARTEDSNGNLRQVIVIGDPSTNAGIAPVDATAGVKVNLGADNDITGTVTANLSATDNQVLDDISADTGNIDTNAGATSDAASTAGGTGSISAKLRLITTQLNTLDGNTNGIETLLSGIASYTDGLEDAVAASNVLLGTIDADTGAIKTATEAIQAAQLADGHNVTVDNASIAVTNAGITTIAGAVSGTEMQVDVATIAAGDNNIGNVDVASIAAGDNNIGNVDIASALPAGTNAIGKLAANSGVDIGDVDVTSLPALAAGTNAVGKLLPPDIDVTTHTNYAKKYYTNSGAVTDGVIWSPAAGKRWHVVSLFIQVSAAATVTLEDDLAAGDSAVLKMELAANSGISIPFPEKYPLASGEDAADLIITTSAGNVYVTCVGYEI